ncbi:MAG TPA: amidohydrolase [Vicinamibacteria bacterium]|nr:amidohydrolase [Vicinamibacteria bacterium]
MRKTSRRASGLAVLAVLAVLPVARAQTQVEPATLVLRNGLIATVDDARPQAQALAARGDTLVAVGSNEDIARYVGPKTRVIDLQGRRAVPGFIESHGHFTGVGDARIVLNLTRVKNWDEIVAMVKDAAGKARPGEWMRGRGWHQEKWDRRPQPAVEGFPTHASLSAVSPNNPVVLEHASGHASFANAKAMELAGVTRDTKSPAGGDILKDAKGEPTGLFRETADGLLDQAYTRSRASLTPEQREAYVRRQLQLADEEAVSKGITSFEDAGSSFETIDVMKKVASEGKLGLRLWVMIRDSNERMTQRLAAYRLIDGYDKHLTVRAIKHTLDGALGSRGAWLLEPYSDLPTSTGLETTPLATVKASAELAMQHGYQLCVHAIGDRANRETLDLFEAAMKAHPDKKDVRWRVEHAQHLSLADIPRFGRLGVIASMQGIHCTSDAVFVPARLDAKRSQEGAYVWQKLMKSGAVIANGTDAPVEDVDPIANFYATVTRRLANGSTFYPDQRMSREEALRSYTRNGAYAAFQEGSKGSLTVGKLADVTVLSKDILTVPDDEIRSARVDYTIVGGKVLYPIAER